MLNINYKTSNVHFIFVNKIDMYIAIIISKYKVYI